MKKDSAPCELRFFLLVALIFLPGCVHRRQIDKQKLHIDIPLTTNIQPISNTPPPITIWVHGTVIFYKPIYHQIFDNNSCLMPALSLPDDHHFRLLAQSIATHDSEHFPLEEFYIFGWSGKLQNQQRKEAAHKLCSEIVAVQERYKTKYGCEPIIRIIAHSHGGNVVLNMAKIKTAQGAFKIKSLILLACPVQEKTMHLISTPMFQRVYSLYSSLDLVQIIAPQFKRICSTDCVNNKHKHRYRIPPFSSRIFPIYGHLTQAKIKINDFPISHTRFSTKEFTCMLPTILHKLDSWHAESLAAHKISKYKLLCIYQSR